MMDLVERIKGIDGVEVTVQRHNRVFVDVDKDRVIDTLYYMKNVLNITQLSFMNVVDRINEGKFEIFYVLYEREEKINVIVRVWIDRDNPVIDTADKIYPPAHNWEREVAEMFGIKVEGNEDAGKPFILENWKDMPPMRKDFDSVKYCNEHYVFRHSEDENE